MCVCIIWSLMIDDSLSSLFFTFGVGLCFCSIFLKFWYQRGQYGIDLQCSSQFQLYGYMHNFSPQVVCITTDLQKLRLVAAQIMLDSLLQLLGEIFQTSSYKYYVTVFVTPSWNHINLPSYFHEAYLRLRLIFDNHS